MSISVKIVLKDLHDSSQCLSPYTCRKCGKKHSFFIHDVVITSQSKPVGQKAMMVDSDVCTHLPVVAVMLCGKFVYALLDTGSTASYVSREIADELGLERKNL